MKAAGISDPNDVAKVRALGVVDLPTLQKKLNLHYTLSLDLFGFRSLHQRRQRLQCRRQGPIPRDPDQGRSSPAERHLSGAQAGERRDQAGSTSRH